MYPLNDLSENPCMGDELFVICGEAVASLWQVGESLTFVLESIGLADRFVENTDQDSFEMNFPIGMNSDESVMTSNRDVTKEDFTFAIEQLRSIDIPVSVCYHLVTVVESFLNDIVRKCCERYPKKISSGEKISVNKLLECSSIEEFQRTAVDQVIGKISYLGSADYAQEFEKYTSVSLESIPAWHEYVEFKATRDIYIHNRGVVNDLYLKKTSTSARSTVGNILPIPFTYLWRKYEACIKLMEEIQERLNDKWHSPMMQEQKKSQSVEAKPVPAAEKIVGAKDSEVNVEAGDSIGSSELKPGTM